MGRPAAKPRDPDHALRERSLDTAPPAPRFLLGGAPEQITRLLRASVSPPVTQGLHGVGGRGSGVTGSAAPRWTGPLRGPPLSPGPTPPSLSFPICASSPQAEEGPQPLPGAHRQARHNLDRAAVAEVPSGLRRCLGHGRRHLLRAARPPRARGTRRRPFAAPSPADAPAHAHARHARRGAERGAREQDKQRARPQCAGDGGRRGANLKRVSFELPAVQGAGPGLGAVEAEELDLSVTRSSFSSPNLQKPSFPSLFLLPQVPLSPFTVLIDPGTRLARCYLPAFALAVPLSVRCPVP